MGDSIIRAGVALSKKVSPNLRKIVAPAKHSSVLNSRKLSSKPASLAQVPMSSVTVHPPVLGKNQNPFGIPKFDKMPKFTTKHSSVSNSNNLPKQEPRAQVSATSPTAYPSVVGKNPNPTSVPTVNKMPTSGAKHASIVNSRTMSSKQVPFGRGLSSSSTVLSASGTGRKPFGFSPQKREIHIGFQGSGVPASAQSNVKEMNDSYTGPNKLMIGGPGADENLLEAPLGGAYQSDEGQQNRNDHAKRALIEAYESGDDRVHLSGHSRGAGNALLLAQELDERGLVHPDTGRQVRPPGVPVHSVTLFDAVPHMGGAGNMNVFKDGGTQNVPYEHPHASMPSNVQNYTHIYAGGEQRTQFRQANIPRADSGLPTHTAVVPNATHKDVGGNPNGNPAAIALARSEAVNAAHKANPDDFRPDPMTPDERDAAVEEMSQAKPKTGMMEKMIGALGSAPRTFPPGIEPMKKNKK